MRDISHGDSTLEKRASHLAHNQETVGSTPTGATIYVLSVVCAVA